MEQPRKPTVDAELTSALDDLVQAIRQSPKYRAVFPDLVRSIGARELRPGRRIKDAIKATKNTLHQIAASYVDTGIDSARALADLRVASEAGPETLRAACIAVMKRHASTRERIELLGEFYTTTLAGLGPIHSVLDLACGLNPLTLPWMPLAGGARYYACDIFEDLVRFMNDFFGIVGVAGRAALCDLTQGPPDEEVDLALLLKTIPCLEHLDKQVGLRLLDRIRAKHVLVSYPVRTLGGRQKGMAESYEARFRAMIADRPWAVQRFAFRTELAFLVTR